MSIEDNFFKKYVPNYTKLKEYGFELKENNYYIEKFFKNNLFKAIIKINRYGQVAGTVYDIENSDEFLPLRASSNSKGAFVNEVRAEYENVLSDIRDKCFTKTCFIFPQSNRITHKIIKKYGDSPEFLWDKFKGSAIFRNPESRKWYAVILDTTRVKFGSSKDEPVEVLDIKLAPAHIEELLNKNGFYPAYHMNKKYWITVILDETVDDNEIMQLMEESRGYTIKHKKINNRNKNV